MLVMVMILVMVIVALVILEKPIDIRLGNDKQISLKMRCRRRVGRTVTRLKVLRSTRAAPGRGGGLSCC